MFDTGSSVKLNINFNALFSGFGCPARIALSQNAQTKGLTHPSHPHISKQLQLVRFR